MSGPRHGLCGHCQREIVMRRDGRLKAHLALSSRAGHRQSCEGSGSFSARLELLTGSDPAITTRTPLSAAAAFNARAEWDKADVLYQEYLDMCECDAADLAATDSAYEAYARAWDGAKTLAPYGPIGLVTDQPEAI